MSDIASQEDNASEVKSNFVERTIERTFGRSRVLSDLADPSLRYNHLGREQSDRVYTRVAIENLLNDLERSKDNYNDTGVISIAAQRRRSAAANSYADNPVMWEILSSHKDQDIDTCQVIFGADGKKLSSKTITRMIYPRDDKPYRNQVEMQVAVGNYVGFGLSSPARTVMAIYRISSIADITDIPERAQRRVIDQGHTPLVPEEFYGLNLDLAAVTLWTKRDGTRERVMLGYTDRHDQITQMTEIVWDKLSIKKDVPVSVDLWALPPRAAADLVPTTEVQVDLYDSADFLEALKQGLYAHRQFVQGAPDLDNRERHRHAYVHFAYAVVDGDEGEPSPVVRITAHIISQCADYVGNAYATELTQQIPQSLLEECPLAVYNSKSLRSLISKVEGESSRLLSAYY